MHCRHVRCHFSLMAQPLDCHSLLILYISRINGLLSFSVKAQPMTLAIYFVWAFHSCLVHGPLIILYFDHKPLQWDLFAFQYRHVFFLHSFLVSWVIHGTFCLEDKRLLGTDLRISSKNDLNDFSLFSMEEGSFTVFVLYCLLPDVIPIRFRVELYCSWLLLGLHTL